MPHDVVTMNSSFVLEETNSGKSKVATLVYPDEVWRDGAISVLTPLGMALLEVRVKQRLPPSPTSNANAVEVREVLYQPEAAGDFDR
jgi:regulator of nucleoside diphosphate kinase